MKIYDKAVFLKKFFRFLLFGVSCITLLYFFQVQPVSLFAQTNECPAASTNLTPATGTQLPAGTRSVTISWNGGGAGRFSVLFSGTGGTLFQNSDYPATSATVNGLQDGGSYTWSVRPYSLSCSYGDISRATLSVAGSQSQTGQTGQTCSNQPVWCPNYRTDEAGGMWVYPDPNNNCQTVCPGQTNQTGTSVNVCAAFMISSICNQPSYNNCTGPYYDGNRAYYQCKASQDPNRCSGKIYCGSLDKPFSGVYPSNVNNQGQVMVHTCDSVRKTTTCNQTTYEGCTRRYNGNAAYYHCVSPQNDQCVGDYRCDAEDKQTTPTPPTPSTGGANANAIVDCPAGTSPQGVGNNQSTVVCVANANANTNTNINDSFSSSFSNATGGYSYAGGGGAGSANVNITW